MELTDDEALFIKGLLNKRLDTISQIRMLRVINHKPAKDINDEALYIKDLLESKFK